MNRSIEEWRDIMERDLGLVRTAYVGGMLADVLDELLALRKRVAHLEGINFPGEIAGH